MGDNSEEESDTISSWLESVSGRRAGEEMSNGVMGDGGRKRRTAAAVMI